MSRGQMSQLLEILNDVVRQRSSAMMRFMRRLSVAIVGCGVGGCTAALLLAREGHAVTMFEQSPRVGPVGAGVLLQASGQRVLRELDLLDSVINRAERIDQLIAYTHRGRLLSRLRFTDAPGGHVAYGLHRGDLFSVLHAAVLQADVNVRLNHLIARVGSDGRTLIDSADQSIGSFDLIVAADGSRSKLRQSSRIRAFVYSYGSAALWAVGRDPVLRGQLLQRARHTRQLCGLLPMGDGRASFFWGVTVSDWPRLRESSFVDWQRSVIELLPSAEPMVSTLRGFADLTFSTYRAVFLPRVVKGRIAFLGDAAHASSPILGHGINLAMLDARDLADAVSRAPCVSAALNHYDSKQRWRNAYYSTLSAALSPSFQGNSKWIGVARDIALPRLQQVPPLRRLMLRTLAGV